MKREGDTHQQHIELYFVEHLHLLLNLTRNAKKFETQMTLIRMCQSVCWKHDVDGDILVQ